MGPRVACLDPRGHHLVEPVAVELIVRHVEAVATVGVHEGVVWKDPPQPRNVRLHRTRDVVGERVPPQQVGDSFGRQRAVGMQQKGGDEASLEVAAQRTNGGVAARNGELAEHAISGLAVPGHAARVYEPDSIRPSRRPDDHGRDVE